MSFRKLLDLLYDAAGYLAAFFVLAIFVAMIAQTVMREAGFSTSGFDDYISWFCAGSFFLAMAHSFRHGDFVRVTLVLERLGPGPRRAFEATSLAIGAVFCGYLAWWSARYVHESWQYGEMSTGVIVVPIWIPQLSFTIGAVLLFVAVVDQLVVVLRGRKPIYVILAEERHARGDYSEDF
jgi:TRAP-type C4-dicarboxylate transport system permease small subunit